MLHPIQVLEALEAGARCILIIVRALSDDSILALKEAADCAQLDILYEIHSERELEKALSYDPKIIGVNNRDLTRFQTDLSLIPKLQSLKSQKASYASVKVGFSLQKMRPEPAIVGRMLSWWEKP